MLVRAPVNDVIYGRRGTHVAEAMEAVGGVENHRTRADPDPVSIGERLAFAFAEDDEFLVDVAMRGMRLHARVQRGYMDLELIDGRGGGFADGTDLARSGLVRLHFVPVKDGRAHDRR